ncbi:MAG: nucleoid-associated protein [Gammaproteobacteria bacterium]|nr:nucleoid-associated protein [Gammaproteobacteria bacterium]
MPIQHACISQISFSPESGLSRKRPSSELPTEGGSEQLLADVKRSFLARISREHGSFGVERAERVFGEELGKFLDNSATFLEMCEALAQNMESLIESQKVSFDGHLLFFIEKSLGNHFFYLFVTGMNESLTIDADLQITTSRSVDTSSSLYGIKVDLIEWREHKHYAYISLLPPRQQDMAALFYQYTGFVNGIDKSEQTLTFLNGIENFTQAIPEEQQKDYRDKVVEYCVECEEMDSPVDLSILAREVEGIDRDEFLTAMSDYTPDDKQKLMMDRRSLRQYVKFAGRERDLAISFSAHQLNNRVQYDAGSDTLSIKGLPNALRKQLLGHLKEE